MLKLELAAIQAILYVLLAIHRIINYAYLDAPSSILAWSLVHGYHDGLESGQYLILIRNCFIYVRFM